MTSTRGTSGKSVLAPKWKSKGASFSSSSGNCAWMLGNVAVMLLQSQEWYNTKSGRAERWKTFWILNNIIGLQLVLKFIQPLDLLQNQEITTLLKDLVWRAHHANKDEKRYFNGRLHWFIVYVAALNRMLGSYLIEKVNEAQSPTRMKTGF